MSYEICHEETLECQVANLIFREGVDYWMGYHTDSEIRAVIQIVSTYFHDLAETLIDEIRKRLTVKSYYDPVTVKEPEREWELLNLISTKEKQVSYEEFCKEYQEYQGWLESLFRMALVASLCITDLAVKYHNQVSDEKEVEYLPLDDAGEESAFDEVW